MTDLVAQAAAELYAAEPEEFTAHRKRLVAAARAAGDKKAAGRIGELRKPTKAAWLLNRLVREQPEVPAQLAMVGDGLRSAERARDGARLRELSGARSALVGEFTARALASVADPPAGLREDVAGTLEAAIADPEVAADLSAGTLTRAVRWAGFGLGAGLAPVADTPSDAADTGGPADAEMATDAAATSTRAPTGADGPASADGPADAGRSASAGVPTGAVTPASARETAGSGPAGTRPKSVPAIRGTEPTARETPAKSVSLRVTAERNRRKQELRDAERALANAATLAESAEEDETRLEDLVRELEQRLVTAREELSAARLRSRRAEVAERKARQALDRLRPPDEGRV